MKTKLSILTCLMLLAWPLQAADDVPAWQENLHYSWQSWDFGPVDGPAPGFPGRGDGPLAPDNGTWTNSAGTPGLVCALTPGKNRDTAFSDPWWVEEKCGRSYAYGGIGNTALIFEVPLQRVDGLSQELWVQFIHRETGGGNWKLEAGRKVAGTPQAECDIADVKVQQDEYITIEALTDEELENGWHRVTARVRVDAAPTAKLYLKISALREWYFFDLKRNAYISDVSIASRSVLKGEANLYGAPPAPIELPFVDATCDAAWVGLSSVDGGVQVQLDSDDLTQSQSAVLSVDGKELPVEFTINPQAGSTSQSWHFDAPEGEELPIPDGNTVVTADEYVNTAGTPVLKYAMLSSSLGGWVVKPPMGSWGFTGMYGGMGAASLILEVPDNSDSKSLVTVEWVVYLKSYSEGGKYIEIGNELNGSYSKSNLNSMTVSSSELVELQHSEIDDGTGRIWHKFRASAFVDSAPKHYVRLIADDSISGIDRVKITTAASSPVIASDTSDLALRSLDGAAATETVEVWNAGEGVLTWQAESDASWLSIDPASDISLTPDTKNTLTVTANPAGLSAGDYSGQVKVWAPNIAPLKIPVSFRVADQGNPAIGCDIDELNLNLGDAPELTLRNSGGGALNWTAAVSDSNVTLSPAAGTLVGSDQATIIFNFDQLEPGEHSLTLTITAGDQVKIVPVTVIVPDDKLPELEDWHADPGYTWQAWQFNCTDVDDNRAGWQIPACTVAGDKIAKGSAAGIEYDFSPGIPAADPALAPDMVKDEARVAFVNAGTPLLREVLLHELAGWSHMPMAGTWDHSGVYGGMGNMAAIFELPLPAGKQELALSFTFFSTNVTRATGGQDYEVVVGRTLNSLNSDDPSLRTQVGNRQDFYLISEESGRVRDANHSETKYWHTVAQHWELEGAPARVYIKVRLLTGGTATMLDSFTVQSRNFDGAAAPTVLSHKPGSANVGLNSPVELKFSRNMDHATTRAAFRLLALPSQDEVEGALSWSGSTLIFTPHDPYVWSSSYRVELAASAQDVTGLRLASPYSFEFSTKDQVAVEPLFEGLPAAGATLADDSLTIRVSKVSKYRYRLNFEEWSDEMTEPLNLTGLSDGDYTLEIQVADEAGTWQSEVEKVDFVVAKAPTVVNSSPRGQAPQDTTISISFSEEMQKDTVEVSIDPVVEGVWRWNGNTYVFTPNADLDEEVQYQVDLAASAEDLAGNKLAEAHRFSFTVYAGSVTITCPVQYDTYLLAGTMGGRKGYPSGKVLKSGHMVDIRTAMKFDLSEIATLDPQRIVKADLCYNMLQRTSAADAMDLGPVSAAGGAMYGFISVLGDSHIWDEAQPDAVAGYSGTGLWGGNLPDVVSGSPIALARHITGKNAPGAVDITEIVRGWVAGDYANNGLQLRDHNDNYYLNDPVMMDSGFGWFINSRESGKGACLKVQVAERLHILNKPRTITTLSAGASLSLQGSSDGDWRVLAPNGAELTSANGSSFSFTAPSEPGVYTIELGEDSMLVGVGSRKDAFCPLFAPLDSVLWKVCTDLMDQLGASANIGYLSLNGSLVGGSGAEHGARLALFDLADYDGELALGDSELSYSGDAAYIMLADTGRTSWDYASNIFVVGLYDAQGSAIEDEYEFRLAYNDEVVFSGMFEDGECSVLSTVDFKTFFTTIDSTGKDPRQTVASLSGADYDAGLVSFKASGGAAFGLALEKGSVLSEEEANLRNQLNYLNDMDSGCFINSLKCIE